jgi:ribosomal protein L11 methyltransferase
LIARWRVLTARVPDALDDEIAAVLGSGSLGVEVAASGPGMSELRVYLGLADDAPAWRERAGRVLLAHGLVVAEARLAIDPVADGHWVEHWQASLSPISLGARFVVLPTKAAADPDGREPIRLIPGRAFGTGEHQSTRLCAAGLEERVALGSRWLDLGTGTGLLAIVAARCGAVRVLALDLDPEAAEVASEVVAANAAGDVVEVRAGSIADRGGETFDGIVANIQSSFFIANAAGLTNALVHGGVLLASGFLDEDVVEVSTALGAAGLRVEARASDGPWACLLAQRREA